MVCLSGFASDATPDGNPFVNAAELKCGNYEWQRKLACTPAQPILLCCPEDVRHTGCKPHSTETLCRNCEVPFCRSCVNHLWKDGKSAAIPMALCNDNFWGYSTPLIQKYKVRWIESAIVSPCLTTMIVYCVEGDRGHLMNEEVGQQQFRTVVRGSCCSFRMPWEDIIDCLRRNCFNEDLT